jgi:hypothetical protein
MARLSIYVTDELKARMDGVGDDVNWSEVVRPAIQRAIAIHQQRRSPSMNTAIERLRASKQEAVREDTDQGAADGRDWAENEAEYRDLVRLSKIDDCRENLFRELWKIVPDISEDEAHQYFFGDLAQKDLSEEYIYAFIQGAQKFFAEIKHKL